MRKQKLLLGYLVLAFLTLSCGKGMLKEEKKVNEIASVNEKQKTIGTQSVPEYCDDLANPCTDPACAFYYECDETINYAGVQITYETSSGMLKFNSVADVNTVIEQLNTDYETYNANYDNQYPNYTADQLDSMDVINNFDEFRKFKDFENLLPGYFSKRGQIENTENTWLTNNFSGIDPDSIDLTFDDAENTIFNNSYSFKVGSSLYELRSEGLYVNGILQDDGGASMSFGTVCKSNKKRKAFPTFDNDTRRFKIKVAIHSIAVRSGVHGKVVHYKKKNGSWKRKRAEMAVSCAGTVYDGNCANSFQFTDREPNSGFRKRKQLATRRHTQAQPPSNSTIWKTYSGEVASSFDTPNTSIAGTLLLTF